MKVPREIMLHYYLNNYYYLVSTHVYIFLVCANNIKKMRTNTGKHINPVHQIILVMKKLWNPKH